MITYWIIMKQYNDQDKAIKATVRDMLITGESFGAAADRIIANTPVGHAAPERETLLRKLAKAKESLERR
jgi:chorismate synthase